MIDKLFDGSDAHLLPGNAELIANLRGENLECNCCAYSRSECSCDTCWPESFTNKAADALEAADKRIAKLEAEVKHYMNAFDLAYNQAMKNGQAANEAERKLAMAREAIQQTIAENGHLADGEVCTLKSLKEALAQIGGDDE